MGFFTSRRERDDNAAVKRGQDSVNRLRVFVPVVAAGLLTEGHSYAARAIGLLVAISGWPALHIFVHTLGQIEHDIALLQCEDHGRAMDQAFGQVPAVLLMKAIQEPITAAHLGDMRAVTARLLVWWGLGDEPPLGHPIVRLMHHFGGRPFKPPGTVQEAHRGLDAIRNSLTTAELHLWKQAEDAMSVYGGSLSVDRHR